jgi:NAD(P)-dependent dehydrogenase (short-subunit alcohol dehydrogenase family)
MQQQVTKSDSPDDDAPKPPFPEQHLPGVGLEKDLEPKPRYGADRYKPAGKLEGKVALVTGGDSGIGRAVAYLYAREGADIAINYLPEEQIDAEETKRAVESAGRQCLLLPGDIASAEFCRSLVKKTVDRFGHLDILVSNAAHQNRKETLADLADDELDRTFKVNIYAYVWLARAALEVLPDGGAIIATGSVTGLLGSPQLPDYSATKGAINAFSKALAVNLLERRIRVNVVAPGPVWTPLNPADDGLPPEKVAEFGKNNPMKRPAQPEELAPAYVFLASNADSSFITGTVLQVMGGETSGG